MSAKVWAKVEDDKIVELGSGKAPAGAIQLAYPADRFPPELDPSAWRVEGDRLVAIDGSGEVWIQPEATE